MSDPQACYCSEYQSSGVPCPPGTCPNVPKPAPVAEAHDEPIGGFPTKFAQRASELLAKDAPAAEAPERVTHQQAWGIAVGCDGERFDILNRYIAQQHAQQEQSERAIAELAQSLQTERAYKNGAQAKLVESDRKLVIFQTLVGDYLRWCIDEQYDDAHRKMQRMLQRAQVQATGGEVAADIRQLYPCATGGAARAGRGRLMSWASEYECSHNAEPVCPYCGAEQGDFWEVSGNSEGDGDHQCDNCNRKFRWSCEVSVTYTTTPVVGPHKLDEFWQRQDAEQTEREL